MMRRRRFLTGVAAATGLLAIDRRAVASDEMTVILDWLLNANHAALFAAQQTGAFGRAGLTVNLVAPADPDSPARLVAAGQADLAVSYGTQINMIDAAGLPLLRVATLIDRPLNTVMALGDGGIRTLTDLKGKKIGISVGGVEEALLDAMLQSVGLAADDITPVKVNYDMVTALISHGLDAAIGAFRNAEVLQVRQMGLTPIVFLPEDHGVPPYDELILVARRDRRDDPRLKRFVTALQEGTTALLKAPDSMWQAFAQAHTELATPLNHASWNATVSAIAADPAKLDTERYVTFQSFALAHGIIDKTMPLDQFAVQLVV
jgi:putative hydroxymethylpyrimidine transport system substrate-binding protein